MRKLFFSLICAAAWGLCSPVALAAAVAETAVSADKTVNPQEAIYRDFLQTASDLWFLLSGIRNKADADDAAPRFTDYVQRICLLDEQLSRSSTESGLPVEVEADVTEDAASAEVAATLENLQLRFLDAFEDVNAEFLSLCRVQCYDSRKLEEAFAEAVQTGMFPEESLAVLQGKEHPLSDLEAEQELVRRRHLEEPDRAVLSVLQQVKDAASAQKAVAVLSKLSDRLRLLLPSQELGNRTVSARYRDRVCAAYEPISPLLWGIRTELVRIAALPDYDSASYDDFSDTLNHLFEDISATHSEWFDDVFDASFRMDMDEALQENAPSSH